MSSLWNYLWKLSLIGVGASQILALTISEQGNAQITPDNTLGAESSVVIPNVEIQGLPSDAQGQELEVLRVDGGAIRGANLFHSFQEFNVREGRGVYFTNPQGIENILSRVTGASRSEILGTLGVLGNANLFLINPNGIIFGQNAKLDVEGSFVATTANAIGFSGQGLFSATAPNVPTLLTVNPSAFFFNQIPTGKIEVQSIAPAGLDPSGQVTYGLRVPNGQSLFLVGGDIRVDGLSFSDAATGNGGGLKAFDGRIELGGLTAIGTVGLSADNNNLRLSFPDGVARSNITLTNGANVNVRALGRGSIAVHAQNLAVEGYSQLWAGIASGLSAVGSQRGNIEINTLEAVNLNSSSISNVVQPNAVGNTGDIGIKTGSLSVTNGARVETSSFGQGNAGNLKIEAREKANFINGGFALTTVEQKAVGNGGELQIQTGSISVENGSQLKVSTLSQGDSGKLTISARDTVEFTNGSFGLSQVESEAVGNGGNIEITTDLLSVSNGSILSASTIGKGDAGKVKIDARDTVSFSNGSGLFSTVEQDAVGNGNNIEIHARSISVANGAFITANTLGQGNASNVKIEASESVKLDRGTITSSVGLNGQSAKLGNGGTINITTGSLQLANQAQLLANSYGTKGNAGSINVTARDTIYLSDTSYIFSQVVGATTVGDGGNINISTGSLSIGSGSILSTDTFGIGKGGNIKVEARDNVSLITEGGIYSLVNSGAIGNGGDIDITTGSLVLTDGSFLAASTLGTGNAGNVTITATGSIFLDGVNKAGFPGGIYSEVASADAIGNGGNIKVNTRSLTATNGADLATDTIGRGRAGKLTINATDSIAFDGVGSSGTASGVYSSVGAVGKGGIGDADDIIITTRLLSLTNGAVVTASTRGTGQGNAGTVRIIADTIFLDGVNGNGFPSTISSRVETEATGNGGGIDITTRSLNVTNGAELSSNSQGNGTAGNIRVIARFINVDNRGKLNAQSRSSNGGNIDLQVRDLLLLRHESQISATAGTAGAGGDGGNITISTPNGFIVSIPNENNDITANAFEGSGGRVGIRAFGVYGIQRRQNTTSLSDITASSESGIDGTVELITPDIDPTQGLAQLQVELVDTASLIADSCIARNSRQQEGTFVITGSGGLPSRPGEALMSLYTFGNVRTNNASTSINSTRRPWQKGDPIVEPQGVYRLPSGQLVLSRECSY